MTDGGVRWVSLKVAQQDSWLSLETIAWMMVSHGFGWRIDYTYIGSISCCINKNYSSASLFSQRNDFRMRLWLEVKVVSF